MTLAANDGSSRARRWLLGAALVLLLALAYAPAFRGDFLWDDDLHVTANPTIVGPLGLKEIWTTARANYFPLVLTNFWLQHAAWGVNPVGYHLVTFGCHVLAALLLWRVLRQLRVAGAWLGAALWALHPVQAESVAWICELKNTQSAVFFLAAISLWLRPVNESRLGDRARYTLALGCALLAVLSKPSTVMLPVVLALGSWWERRQLTRRDAIRLAPFFALSALAAGWTIWEQKFHSGAQGEAWNQSLVERGLIAGRAVWFYLGKLAWPSPLAFIYPRWIIDAANPLAYLPPLAIVAGLVGLWRVRARPAAAAGVFAAASFVALLFPVLGFFNVFFFRYAFVADHFQYLASMAPLALAGAALAKFATRGFTVAATTLVLAATLLTAQEARGYLNRETLWRTTLAHNPRAPMPWAQLGSELERKGRPTEALACYRRALDIDPKHPEALNHVGVIYLLGGRTDDAIAEFQRAIAARPDYPEAHTNLGIALLRSGHAAEARPHFEAALRAWPEGVEAYINLGNALAELDQWPEAVARYEEAQRLQPDYPGLNARLAYACDGLGHALFAEGRVDDAIVQYRRALQLDPTLATAHNNLGAAFAQQGDVATGLVEFDEAARLDPANFNAQLNRGSALAVLGRLPEARDALERAVQLQPDSVRAHDYLARILGALGDEAGARRHADAAARLQQATPKP